MVGVRVHHHFVAAAVARQRNAVVLENRVATVAGLTIAGIGDPYFTPDKTTETVQDNAEDPASSQLLRSGARLAETIRAAGRPVDLALVHDPAALVLDEVANSLDLGASRELRDIVRRIAQAGTTVVMVTHHLSDIIPEIDRVIMLRGGRIVADGSKRAVLRAENLSELFGVPVEVTVRDGYYDAR